MKLLKSQFSVATLGTILLPIVLFTLGTTMLYKLLQNISIDSVFIYIKTIPITYIIISFITTFFGYVVLVGYDWTALSYIKKKIPILAVFTGGLLGYSFGNMIGFSPISGGAVRYRIYSVFGLNAFDVSLISTFAAVSFGIGVTLVGALSLIIDPYTVQSFFNIPSVIVRIISIVVILCIIVSLYLFTVRKKTVRIGHVTIAAPSASLLVRQFIVTATDVLLAATTLFVLLPQYNLHFLVFLSLFSVAIMIGVLSHVPGGIGVFEGIIVAGLSGSIAVEDTVAALLLYRIIYFVIPFVLSMFVLGMNEMGVLKNFFSKHSKQTLCTVQSIQTALSSVTPAVAGTAVLGLGMYLLVVSLLPSVAPQALLRDDILEVLLLEGGTLLTGIAGALLILLAQGLFRRISTSFWITIGVLIIAIGASILNKFDTVSISILLLGIIILIPLKKEFTRKAHIFCRDGGSAWFILILTILVGIVAFFLLFYQDTLYTHTLWSQFSIDSNAPRALRAGLVSGLVLLTGFMYAALLPARSKGTPADIAKMKLAESVIATQDNPKANLALTGDKILFFSNDEKAFLMYTTYGKSWVVYGDPVGEAASATELCWSFTDAAYKNNCRPVFYEVSEKFLSLWIELGLGVHKIGEEAVIDLHTFSLDGPSRKKIRTAHNQAVRSGLSFEIITHPHSDQILTTLKEISDIWLAQKKGTEKAFSVGKFDVDYLNKCPIALIYKNDQIVAFANILQTDTNKSVSIDLMRYLPDCQNGLMDYLFIEMMLHYKNKGHTECSLGMAPLAGLTTKGGLRVWNRLGSVLFKHGNVFYNFSGLRSYKQKFLPTWRPCFVVIPHTTLPPTILKDIALVISGGAKGLLKQK